MPYIALLFCGMCHILPCYFCDMWRSVECTLYCFVILVICRGQWNVPYIANVFLMHGHLLPKVQEGFISGDLDPDMAFCKNLREQVRVIIFVWVRM